MLRVMIVDDEQLIVKGMKKIIERKSTQYVVTGEALGGKEALRIAAKCRPDLVITDICMPDIDGLELISRLKEIIPAAKYVVLSGHEEFAYAQESIRLGVTDYLLKPVNGKKIYILLEKIQKELQETAIIELQKRSQEIREKIYQLLYRNQITLLDYMKEVLDRKKYYTVIIIPFAKKRTAQENQQEMLLLEAFIMPEKLGLITSDEVEMALIVQTDKASDIHFVNHHLAERLKINREGKYYLFCSDTSEVIDDLNVLFQQAKQCQNMSFYRSQDEMIQRWNGSEARSLTIDLIQNEDLQVIIEKMKEEKPDEVIKHYEKILLSFEEMRIEPGDVVRFIQGTFRIVTNYLINNGFLKPLEDELMDEQIYHINECKNKHEIIDGIKKILDEIWIYRQQEMTNTSKIVGEVKKYIQSYYAEEVSLSTLADQVFISPKYLSDLFRRETGETYSHYLTTVRLEHAKQLLGKLNYKIYEIAELVGYSNPKHFIKMFKKETGMTPGEYRNQMK